ncbi:MAG: ATP-dependent DNA ligase [Nanoarchaeota archaeon]|nr:ATP-dependent DNA ligase [Nanoarchaeota archaeon]
MQYIKLARLYEQIEKTSKRLEKSFIISQFFQNCSAEDLKEVMYLIQGKVFPQGDERKLGMNSKLLVKSIAKATGESSDRIEEEWKTLGDLGLVAESFVKNKKQSTLFRKKLTVDKVIENVIKLPEMEGSGTVNRKVGLVAELLSSASPLEARYIIRTVTESLRTGVGDSMIRDSLVWAFFPTIEGLFFKCSKCKAMNPKVEHCIYCHSDLDLQNLPDEYIEIKAREVYNNNIEKVQRAFNVSNDFGIIAEILMTQGPKGLEKLTLAVGKPIKVMLYPKVSNIEEGFEVVGKPAIIEPKLDGFRVQIHRNKDGVNLFTRRLDNVTKQFPDVVRIVKEYIMSKDVILDTEIVGIDPETKRYRPFQEISQRIKRKHDIDKVAKDLPVVITVFDVMKLNGENMIDFPLEERKKKLVAVVKESKSQIEIIGQLVTDDLKKAEEYYQECLDKGLEGVMMKSKEGLYKPGKRVGQGVKVKPVMEPLDLVIVGAEWGEGKRSKWLSSFTVACRDGKELKEMGKVGTGIKEKMEEGVSFAELTKLLKPLILNESGKSVKVKPKIVLEIVYEEIQNSPSYSSGYALRFPRVHRLRDDKGVNEISTIKEIEVHYKAQAKR